MAMRLETEQNKIKDLESKLESQMKIFEDSKSTLAEQHSLEIDTHQAKISKLKDKVNSIK